MVDAKMTLGTVARAWWPLAASWLLMSVELPALGAVVGRLPDATTQLAAYGGVVFPIALIIEAPIIMLLAASTSLCRDRASYKLLRRFMHRSAALLTALHVVLVATPLYDLVVVGLMDVPEAVVAPARVGLLIMLPWTWSIAYRRFNQGIMIRFGHARAVTAGTTLRLCANIIVLWLGWVVLRLPGIVVATSAVASGVVVEAVYAAVRVRSIVRQHLGEIDHDNPPVRGRAFAAFYVPLALTSVITLAAQPLCTAAIARMPGPLNSLALWPIVTGLLFILQAMGLAFTEVVVSMVSRPGALRPLKTFGQLLGGFTGLCVLLVATTPLAEFWFVRFSSMDPRLAAMGTAALWLAIPIPATRAIQSWYQGILVHARRTGPVTESVVLFFVLCGMVLLAGILLRFDSGLAVAIAACSMGRVGQTIWLWYRSRPVERELLENVEISTR